MADVFPFQSYDLLLAFAGAALLLITLGHRLLERLNINSTYLYLLAGVLAGPLLLDMAPDDPLVAVPVLERVTEMAVIIGLVVLGIRIGRPISWRGWQSTARLILVVMPGTIIGVAAAGIWILGLPLGPAVLLGAILAPTDPILAGPLEETSAEEDPEDRFGLSTEAGLNDGMAFPFVYLGVYLTLRPDDWQAWAAEWLIFDLIYAVGMALPIGWIAGRICGHTYVALARRDTISRSRRLFVPLALLLAVYGMVEALGGYGFLAAFTAGHGFRHAFEDHPDRLTAFADFTESVDELAKGAVLILVAALIPWAALWALGWTLLAFALALLLVLRPGLTVLAMAGSPFSRRERGYWAWFGIRGIGSVYYLTYALGQGVEGAAAEMLFIVTIGTVLVSIVAHGLSVRPALAWLKPGEPAEE
jgi:sodium/hydrogen antiporter